MAVMEQRNNDEAKDRCASRYSSSRLSYETRVYQSIKEISGIMSHLPPVIG